MFFNTFLVKEAPIQVTATEKNAKSRKNNKSNRNKNSLRGLAKGLAVQAKAAQNKI